MKKFVEDWGGGNGRSAYRKSFTRLLFVEGQCSAVMSPPASPLIIAPPWPPPQVLCRNFPLNGRFGESCSESPLVPLENTTRVLSG